MTTSSKLLSSNGAGWSMAGPAMALMALFIVAPFCLAFLLSFTNQRLVSPNPTQWVGVSNFTNLLSVGVIPLEPLKDDATGEVKKDEAGAPQYPATRSYTRNNPEHPYFDGMRDWFSVTLGTTRYAVVAHDVIFMKAIVNTLLFVIVVAPAQGALALLLALLINQRLTGINFYRAIYFMPVVVSIAVVSLLWRLIYAADGGMLNTILGALTFGAFKPVDWLGQPSMALWSITAMSIWQAVGFHMVIWLSGLQTIPATLYEASTIEGATGWQVFRYVTWPGLRNTAILVLIVITIQAFGLFAQIDVMTQGGPIDSTQTVVFQAIQRGYVKQDIAGGSTISVVLFVLVLSVSLLQRYLTRGSNR